MIFNGRWDNPKLVLYCQVGKALDMLDFALNQAIANAGLPQEDYDIVFLCWRTSPEVYEYLKKKNLKYVDMVYEQDKNFVWNLYKGWNLGYEVGFKYAPYVCPIATDHAFYKNWLKNLFAFAKPNRIVNCKLIEPIPTLHTRVDFGTTVAGQFKQKEFDDYCAKIYKDELVVDEKKYGHRLEAMPFICPKDVWGKFGPMNQGVVQPGEVNGDTDFFNRCKAGGVEVVKALNAISYHSSMAETFRNYSFFVRLRRRLSRKSPEWLLKLYLKFKSVIFTNK